ncbi:MAG: pyridoxal-phosphate dependent enzyme [Paracoccaceae bacterium]
MDSIKPTSAARDALQNALSHIPAPSTDAVRPLALIGRCPRAGQTPLVEAPHVADSAGAGFVHIKDERNRMGLGSFKALGAAYVIARDAAEGPVSDRTYVTASAGNHGMSVAAGAAAFGANAVIYIAETVPDTFAARLRDVGAEVRREGAIYEDSMAAAAKVAEANGWDLLSDSSWEGYVDRPWTLMEGYLILMAEAVEQMPEPPSHIFLQAGVGGLAGAAAAYARHAWGSGPRIIVVEPEVSAPLFTSAAAGAVTVVGGPSSAMGRLDCKEASLIALKGLIRDADDFSTITEAEGIKGAAAAANAGFPSTPSGAASLSALLAGGHTFGVTETSRVLLILSEGPGT